MPTKFKRYTVIFFCIIVSKLYYKMCDGVINTIHNDFLMQISRYFEKYQIKSDSYTQCRNIMHDALFNPSKNNINILDKGHS